MVIRNWNSQFIFPGLFQASCWVKIKRVNGNVDRRDRPLLCGVEGEQGISQRPRWMVGEVRVVGFDKIPGLKKSEKMRVRQFESGCKFCKISEYIIFVKVPDM